MPQRGETIFDGGIPNYNMYLTKDDKYITIGGVEPWFFANLCRALGREDFIPHDSKTEQTRPRSHACSLKSSKPKRATNGSRY